jgi:predicted GH43/DUF377 family glycosyl hydrolase
MRESLDTLHGDFFIITDATQLPSGETLLLVRVEDRRGISHLTVAHSPDGTTNWQIDTQPMLLPDPEHYPEEIWGIEDPRLTWVKALEAP